MQWFIGTSGFMVNKKTWLDLSSLSFLFSIYFLGTI